jgi:hypothetical protein
MKFSSSAVEEAAATAPPDDGSKKKSNQGNIVKKSILKTKLPKAKTTLIPDGQKIIRVIVPHDEKIEGDDIKKNSHEALLSVLHLFILSDSEASIINNDDWLEGSPDGPGTKTTLKSITLNETIAVDETTLNQFIETHNEKRRLNTTTYLRFCIATTVNVPKTVAKLKAKIRETKSKLIVDIYELPEIMDYFAGWLHGCDPRFLASHEIHRIITDGIKTSMPNETMPIFSVKKKDEKLNDTTKGKTQAPVVKIQCEGDSLPIVRAMMSKLKIEDLFVRFVANNLDIAERYEALNDHIDHLSAKRYTLLTGPAIMTSTNILLEECIDDTGISCRLAEILKAQGILCALHDTETGKRIFSQTTQSNHETAIIWIDENFGEATKHKWVIRDLPKTIRATKGSKATSDVAKVPETIKTNRAGSPETSGDSTKLSQSHSRSDTSYSGASMLSQLTSLQSENSALKQKNYKLAKELETFKEFKKELEKQKQQSYRENQQLNYRMNQLAEVNKELLEKLNINLSMNNESFKDPDELFKLSDESYKAIIGPAGTTDTDWISPSGKRRSSSRSISPPSDVNTSGIMDTSLNHNQFALLADNDELLEFEDEDGKDDDDEENKDQTFEDANTSHGSTNSMKMNASIIVADLSAQTDGEDE